MIIFLLGAHIWRLQATFICVVVVVVVVVGISFKINYFCSEFLNVIWE